MDQKVVTKRNSKAKEIWKKTLMLHKRAPETRIASSLSVVEIFVTLFYGVIVKFNPLDPTWENPDRFIVNKWHGSILLKQLKQKKY